MAVYKEWQETGGDPEVTAQIRKWLMKSGKKHKVEVQAWYLKECGQEVRLDGKELNLRSKPSYAVVTGPLPVVGGTILWSGVVPCLR